MPIVASRGSEIRNLLAALADPRKRAGAVLRLRKLGSRVVPHAEEELGRLDPEARRALAEALGGIQTDDARALTRRLVRAAPAPPPSKDRGDASAEGLALADLRSVPPPQPDERPAVSRERGEAHLALARTGSRLARKDLLLCLKTLDAKRTRLYCEAAGLIGDAAFLAPLAKIAGVRAEAGEALASIAVRERITARSKVLRDLDEKLRPIVARAIALRPSGRD